MGGHNITLSIPLLKIARGQAGYVIWGLPHPFPCSQGLGTAKYQFGAENFPWLPHAFSTHQNSALKNSKEVISVALTSI